MTQSQIAAHCAVALQQRHLRAISGGGHSGAEAGRPGSGDDNIIVPDLWDLSLQQIHAPTSLSRN